MGNPDKEPLCTAKELLVFGVICIIYSSIVFSLDPEWVGWAAPLVFGGTLYAADPPPASAHLDSPQHVLPMAYLCYTLSLVGLVLLTLFRDGRHSGWRRWFKAELQSRSIARVGHFLRSSFSLMSGR